MGLIRKPWFTFNNLASTGLGSIPLNSNVHILDDSLLSDGSGGPLFISVIDITDLGGTIANIEDLLAATTQWVGIGSNPHGYIEEISSATFTPDFDGTDFFEY